MSTKVMTSELSDAASPRYAAGAVPLLMSSKAEITADHVLRRITPAMRESPSPNGPNGRNARGRFARGNAGGPGNPHAKHVARLRSALFDAVSPQDVMDVVSALLALAKGGEVPAAKELLQRLLGPPVELDLIERLENLERQIAESRTPGGGKR
jgi:hypothetical protein